MTHLLDTNVCVNHLRGRDGDALVRRLAVMHRSRLVICSVVRAELVTGALKSRDPNRSLADVAQFVALFPSAPFDDDAADAYGQVRADLERDGMKIGANDLLIAAIALVNNLTLVTHNTGEFARIPRLRLEDWQP